uniref:Uncharacterized protein n=1 Tax=Oryza brachyantha TaxID=4533 RepID=J3MFH6_ORYBR
MMGGQLRPGRGEIRRQEAEGDRFPSVAAAGRQQARVAGAVMIRRRRQPLRRCSGEVPARGRGWGGAGMGGGTRRASSWVQNGARRHGTVQPQLEGQTEEEDGEKKTMLTVVNWLGICTDATMKVLMPVAIALPHHSTLASTACTSHRAGLGASAIPSSGFDVVSASLGSRLDASGITEAGIGNSASSASELGSLVFIIVAPCHHQASHITWSLS